MDKNGNIGSINKQKGLPNKINQDTKTEQKVLEPVKQESAKPVFTDDNVNVQPKDSNTANGYNEKKQTEPGNQLHTNDENTVTNVAPEAQPSGTQKTYGDGREPVFTEKRSNS